MVPFVRDEFDAYANLSIEIVERIEDDTDPRRRLIYGLGVRGWRRQMPRVELEAMLCKTGLVKRWEVLVSVS